MAPLIGNGWTDCAEIWYVVRDSLAKRFPKVNVRYVRRCTAARELVGITFPYLVNGRMDCTEIWCVARRPVALRFTQDGRFCTNARITHTFKHIYSPPLVHRQKASHWFHAIQSNETIDPTMLFRVRSGRSTDSTILFVTGSSGVLDLTWSFVVESRDIVDLLSISSIMCGEYIIDLIDASSAALRIEH